MKVDRHSVYILDSFLADVNFGVPAVPVKIALFLIFVTQFEDNFDAVLDNFFPYQF